MCLALLIDAWGAGLVKGTPVHPSEARWPSLPCQDAMVAELLGWDCPILVVNTLQNLHSVTTIVARPPKTVLGPCSSGEETWGRGSCSRSLHLSVLLLCPRVLSS